MKNHKLQFYFLLALIALTLVLSFFVLKPFVSVFIMALVITVVFQPIYRRVLKLFFGNSGLAAFITLIIIVVIILTPLAFLSLKIIDELRQLYVSLVENGGKDTFLTVANNLVDSLRRYFLIPPEFSINIGQYLREALNWLLNHVGDLFSNFANLLTATFIFLVTLYYLLKDGHKLKRLVINYSPLANIDDEMILNKLELAVSSVIKGNFTVALLQGILTSIGFYLFGVPSAILWGTAAALASFIPSVGTSLVFIPAVIIIFFSGETYQAIGLAIWGALAVGLIDNFFGPKLIGRGMKLHPLLVLFAVIGGAIFFGPVGFFLGPIILSLLFVLIHIYNFVNTDRS